LFLGGRLCQNAIACIVPGVDPVETAETLLESGLFTHSPEGDNSVQVVHDLMLDEIRSLVSPIRLAGVADRLLLDLDSLVADTGHRKAVRAELLVALAQWPQAYTEALECGRSLATQRQWAQAARYLEIAHDSSQHLEREQERLQCTVHSLLELLEVECLRYRIGLEENLDRLDSLATAFRFIDQGNNNAQWQQVLLRLLLVRWRAHYVREEFTPALTAAVQARELALSMSSQTSIELRGKALSNYAVTLKLLDKRLESFAAFDEALEILPDSITLQAERLSNIAAFALRDNPKRARMCFRELLQITKGTSYSFLEIIHTHVDLAMASFLMREYDAAAEEAIIALRLAESNGVAAQEGRAWNIVGCCHWAHGRTSDAALSFDRAAFASERAISRRFLWRIRTNCAGTALEAGRTDSALHYARSAETLILKPREERFEELQSDSIHVTSRWYAALMVIAKCYSELDELADLSRLLDCVTLPYFRVHTEEFLADRYPEEVFAGTTHRHGDRVIITG
jgi:tetratricopeptide (TPR) repeat protein